MNNPIHVLQYAPDFRQSLKSVTKLVKKPIKLPSKMPFGEPTGRFPSKLANNMQYMWQSASKELKLKVLGTCIFPIAKYGCETCVLPNLISKD